MFKVIVTAVKDGELDCISIMHQLGLAQNARIVDSGEVRGDWMGKAHLQGFSGENGDFLDRLGQLQRSIIKGASIKVIMPCLFE